MSPLHLPLKLHVGITEGAVHIRLVLTQVRGSGSKSGTLEKAAQEAHAVRTLAEVTYQDERFRVPPGLLSTPQGASLGASPHMLVSRCKGIPLRP